MLVEEVAKRLNFHNAKIELAKAQFAKFLVNFMGWLISNNTLQPDPKRIAKLQNTPFPKDVTGMRSFQGLVNFLRLVLGFDTLREIHKISPLTSGEKKAKLNPTDEQIAAVERLKSKKAVSTSASAGHPLLLYIILGQIRALPSIGRGRFS